jgi:hypothetical protein
MAKADLLAVRRRFAERGVELTPGQLFNTFNHYHRLYGSSFEVVNDVADADYDAAIIADIMNQLDQEVIEG